MLISISEVGKEKKKKTEKGENNTPGDQDHDTGILMKIRFSPNGSAVIGFR